MRLCPKILEVRDPAHHKDDVDRAITDDLISNIDVAVLGILRDRLVSCQRNGRRTVDHRVTLAVVADINTCLRSFEYFGPYSLLRGFDRAYESIAKLLH